MEIYFKVEGDIPVIAQPTSMSCWATVNTMMVSWKYQQTFTIEAVMDWLQSDFRKLYDENNGLPGNRNNDWANANNMKIEYATCETPEHIYTLLTNHGPIIIIDDENNGITDISGNRLWCVHARIIVGIEGDTTDINSIVLAIIDPADGAIYNETFVDFASKSEAMAEASNYDILIIHY